MSLSFETVTILLASGVTVGFINTLAGGASIISITTFMVLGLPVSAANETNRLPVVFQNMAATVNFLRKRRLDVRLGLRLSIPAILGNLIGSQIAVTVDEQTVRTCLAVVLCAILVFMLLSTERRLGSGKGELRVRPVDYLWFFLIGVYGGYIYVGVGYMVLAVTLMSMKMDIVAANALKGFVMLTSTCFALAFFIFKGNLNYSFGLTHAAGNILGAFLASQYAVGWGVRFLKIFLVVVILGCIADVFGLVELRSLISSLL
jgi:uncharacterized membrane protein YfcA